MKRAYKKMYQVAEEHPLKQGLKHIIIMLTYRIWLEESNIICQ
jgi:hypothetical protein